MKNFFRPGMCLVILLLFLHQGRAQRYTFERISLEQGIPSSRINDFIEDSRGFFWVATEGAGLVRYDGFEFKTIDLDGENLKPIITALAEDDRGHLWMGGENALIEYSGTGFRLYYFPERQERIDNISFGSGDRVLAATKSAVFQTGAGDTLERVPMDFSGRINDVNWFEDELWVASDSGLFRSRKRIRNGAWYNIQILDDQLYAQGDKGFLQSSNDQEIPLHGEHFCVSSGQMLALRNDTLVLFNGSEPRYLTRKNALPDEDFKGCFVDRTGVVWLYSNNGLTKLPGTSFQLYEEIGDEVFSVLQDDGQYFAGTDQGLSLVTGDEVRNLSGARFPFGVVLSIERFGGYYWLGTESGLVRFDGTNFREVSLNTGMSEFIFALEATEEGLWIGTGTGIYKYRRGRVTNISAMEELPFASVYAISEAGDGSLWFATYTDGFFRKKGDQWSALRELGDMRLDSLRFNSVAAVSHNEIWVGTISEGVFHVTDTGSENIAPADLNFAEPRSMAIDNSGNLWAGTNKGLYKIYRADKAYHAKFFNQSRQLLEDGCMPQAIDLKGETLLAGTSNGLLAVNLTELEKPRAAPGIALTDVQLFFGEVEGLPEYAETYSAFTNLPTELELPSNLNFLSFTLAGLSGHEPEDLVYRYRISKEENWTHAGTRREAIYSNLQPGRYEFQAQVARPGEEWSDATVTYPFRINPPVWQQWWFIALSLLIIAGITYWYIRERIARANQRLRLENHLLEMERKALRLQMNPHFIFNALDSISSFIFKKDPKQAVRYLNNFAKLMRLTLESSMEHIHPVETEVSILKNYLELEKLRFQGQLDYRIELDDEIDYDVGIPPMLIQPHVENAILHGIKPKEGRGFVVIRFILKDELLICEIEDDGIGRKKAREMPKRQDHRSMATEINRHRLELLRKSMGHKVDIQIVDKEGGTGTRVIIKLPVEHY